MTQQQKQKERPKQAPRTAGELVIAVLDLLLGLPLAFFLLAAIQPGTVLTDLKDLIIISSIVIAAGLVPAGLLLLLRQNRLGRAFQWLAALGGLTMIFGLAYNFWRYPRQVAPVDILYLSGVVLAALGLILLPFWLRKMDED